MPKIITVVGATGQQGRSVIRTILQNPKLSQEFKIRGITRDVSKPEAQALLKQGIEVKSADMNSKECLSQALQGSHSVFLVTTPAWGNAGSDAELVHGKNVANAAKETGVQHLIFSSLLNVTETSGGRLKHVPHFDHKAQVEQYIRSLGIPATFVLPGYFMTNYTQFGMLRKGDDGIYTLAYPVGKDAKLPLIDIAKDMGKYVAAALLNRSEVLGSQVLAAADYYTPSHILAEFEEVTGQKTRFLQIDSETYKNFIPGPMGLEMLQNHLFIENPGYFNGRSLEESQNLLAKAAYQPESWKEFLEVNKSSFV
ncbi:NmrA/HSCARG family protein [Aspergillus alliaceus]|uniref:NmrA/HSCARG family protein n=1 Tax=Petromyces alliaceus TaxID=209559 RepID=UPI0012A6612C|nr:nmrA family transcriptional regulator [Aspergillus alliaceus]KAB8231678.1 nmrA family transcriptional regulator [Aspergillus alliaceus]